MKIYLILFILIYLTFSCGLEPNSNEESQSSDDVILQDSEILEDVQISFEGFVSNAFEVTVDGEVYDDLEDFYTKEKSRLNEKIIEAGYDPSFEAVFDAEVGFSDLWNNMIVYISSVEDRGYQGQSYISQNGNFQVSLPQKANNSQYKVRAVKRIGIILTSEQETKRICYNFSAVDQSVQLSDQEKPIILKNFESKITDYKCDNPQSNGLEIPTGSDQSESLNDSDINLENDSKEDVELEIKISPYMNKEELLSLVGEDNLSIISDSKWCWFSSNAEEAKMCAVNTPQSCQCSITFDEEGFVSGHENIKSKYLDILSW